MAIDVFTCFATAGAGALVGLGLMAMVPAELPRTDGAVALFRKAFLCLSPLLLISFVPLEWRDLVTKFAVGMAAAGVSLLAWAFRELNGRRTRADLALGVTVLAALVLWGAGIWGDEDTYVRTIAGVFALLGLVTAIDQGWILLRTPRAHGTEISLMIVATLFALMWVLTLGHTFAAGGPYPAHGLYAPDWLLPITAQSFAILPLAVASLVFAVVNQRLNQQLRSRALSDELTGALSRRGFRELGERMLTAPMQQSDMIAVMVLDLDHFKGFNEQHGHQVGDAVLKHVTHCTRAHLREDALLARHGGQEFTVMLPVRSHLEASAVAERLRHTLAETPCVTQDGKVAITVSVGVAFHTGAGTLEDALDRAEVCLREAKEAGRNRVVTAPLGV